MMGSLAFPGLLFRLVLLEVSSHHLGDAVLCVLTHRTAVQRVAAWFGRSGLNDGGACGFLLFVSKTIGEIKLEKLKLNRKIWIMRNC